MMNTLEPTHPQCILLIDDDSAFIETAAAYFSETCPDYDLWSAPNGRVGLHLAQTKLPNLIILDWKMPDLSGLQLIQYLRLDKAMQHTPIIMVTGNNTEDVHLEKALQAGATDYLRKPFSKIELIARSQTAIRLATLHQQEKQWMQSAIAHKNRELSTAIIQVAQKNKFLMEIQQQLSPISKDHPVLKKITRDIKDNIKWDDQWEKFILHFEEVHPDFFARFQQQFPSLTCHELKLCAYCKINLSNKEIAQVLNISVKSVEIARYRLKKKLLLPTAQKLNHFIQQF